MIYLMNEVNPTFGWEHGTSCRSKCACAHLKILTALRAEIDKARPLAGLEVLFLGRLGKKDPENKKQKAAGS